VRTCFATIRLNCKASINPTYSCLEKLSRQFMNPCGTDGREGRTNKRTNGKGT